MLQIARSTPTGHIQAQTVTVTGRGCPAMVDGSYLLDGQLPKGTLLRHRA